MPGNKSLCDLALILVLVFDLFCQVASEYCGNNKYCQSPYKCCANSLACCYDHDNTSYTRGFKLHVWNMWYFWLVVIFILMSCFGGCGYYRRRRLAALQQQQQRSSDPTPPSRRVSTIRPRHNIPPSDMYAYTGPGADNSSNMALPPPPYIEVMQQPGLYPVNKVDLPPYPGLPGDKVPDPSQSNEAMPPPYCEIAMQAEQHNERSSNIATGAHVAEPLESGSGAEHGSRADSHARDS